MNELVIGLMGALIGGAAVWLFLRRISQNPEDGHQMGPVAEPSWLPEVYAVLDNLVEGIVILDEDLRPVLVTDASRRLLGIQGPGLPYRLPSEEIVENAKRALASGQEQRDEIDLYYPLRTRAIVRALPLEDVSGVVVLLRDITEEHRAQQIRREFVSHASHELKSPVASLQTLAEAVRSAVEDDPDAALRFADKMMAEASRLGRLVRDLLDLSRLEDPGQIPTAPADLGTIARREAEHARAAADAKGMLLEVEVGDLWVRGDEAQLGLMIRNLLENAIRYTSEGGRIVLEVRSDRSEAVVRVTDNGIGIPREAQARIFERFYRVDRARSRERGGTGLGLAIVKHVVELHGGQVAVESELGAGSSFTARLPRLEKPSFDPLPA